MKKILVIDGNSIINRAYYGIRQLSTADGRPTNAIYGMVQIVRRQLETLQPDYAAVAFDLKQPTFRHEMFDGYKAKRHPTPEDLLAQFPPAKECLRAMGLHILELPGYEADDLQGTVAAMASTLPDAHAYVLSGDRDLLQLISDTVTVLLVTNNDTLQMTPAAFYEKYGIPSSHFVDLKALMGDSSDNIPGVPGIGEKTALSLIAQFGTIDGVYANLSDPQIKAGVRAKLEAGRESAQLSLRLATICTTAPMQESLEDLTYRGIDRAALAALFRDLEFQALIRKFGLDEAEPAADAPPAGIRAASEDHADAVSPASAAEVLACDDPIAISFSDAGLYLYADGKTMLFSGELSEIAALFDGTRTLLCFDSKALCHLLHRNGVELRGVPRDLMLYGYLLDPVGRQIQYDALCEQHLGSVPTEAGRAAALAELEPLLRRKIEEGGMLTLLDDVELPLALTLAHMEQTGFCIDRRGLALFGSQLSAAADALAATIYDMAGTEFNINSPKQLGEVLFVRLGLPAPKKKKTGFSTDAETLEHLRTAYPIVGAVLEYRHLTKLYSTYAVGLLKATDEEGCLHTDFKQALTATGRLSSAEPNLQNIPIRTELGREMRRYFIPRRPDRVLIDADYSQIELRLLAHLSGDWAMQEAFRLGQDIHSRTAATVFGVPEDEVTSEMRKRAKAVNFGIVYGISGFSLAGDLGIPVAQANDYIRSYFDGYPAVEGFLTRLIEEATERGYSQTLFGRRRFIPELRASNANVRRLGQRLAMNSPIQGTAADIIKIAMVAVERRLRAEGLDAQLVMQVHDELILDANRACADRAAQLLREEMEGAAQLSVPLSVDVSIGENWLCKA